MADPELTPVVVQDAESGAVLMLAYADEEALRRTRESGEAWFWSRSRQELWHKGATSGNTLAVVEIRDDCDGDALLYRVHPAGPACHTGAESCFAPWLWRVIKERQATRPEGSYVVGLLDAGAGGGGAEGRRGGGRGRAGRSRGERRTAGRGARRPLVPQLRVACSAWPGAGSGRARARASARATPDRELTMEIEPFLIERWYERYEFTTELMLSSSDCESWTVARAAGARARRDGGAARAAAGVHGDAGSARASRSGGGRQHRSASRQTSSCSRPPRRGSSSPCTRSCVPATTP